MYLGIVGRGILLFSKNWRKRATRDVYKSRLRFFKEGNEKTEVSKKRKEVGNESSLVSMFQNQQATNLPVDKWSLLHLWTIYVDGTDNHDIFALVDCNLIIDLET